MDPLEFDLTPSPDAPGRARRVVDRWLSNIGCSEATAQNVALVVSELVTNSVLHARSLSRIVVTPKDDRVRIEVHDDDPAPPQLPSEVGAQGGFGMRIVAATADEWGWQPTMSGKVVWTEVRY